MPEPTFKKWQDITKQIILERYGMTELGMVLSNPYDGHKRLMGSVGQPLPFIDCCLVDDNECIVSVPDSPGELRVKVMMSCAYF